MWAVTGRMAIDQARIGVRHLAELCETLAARGGGGGGAEAESASPWSLNRLGKALGGGQCVGRGCGGPRNSFRHVVVSGAATAISSSWNLHLGFSSVP